MILTYRGVICDSSSHTHIQRVRVTNKFKPSIIFYISKLNREVIIIKKIKEVVSLIV